MLQTIVLVLAVIYIVKRRKLNRVTHQCYPHVPREAFEQWLVAERGSYTLFIWSAFGTLLLSLAIGAAMTPPTTPEEVTHNLLVVAGVSTGALLLGLLASAVEGSRAKRLRKQAGIQWPLPYGVSSAPPPLPMNRATTTLLLALSLLGGGLATPDLPAQALVYRGSGRAQYHLYYQRTSDVLLGEPMRTEGKWNVKVMLVVGAQGSSDQAGVVFYTPLNSRSNKVFAVWQGDSDLQHFIIRSKRKPSRAQGTWRWESFDAGWETEVEEEFYPYPTTGSFWTDPERSDPEKGASLLAWGRAERVVMTNGLAHWEPFVLKTATGRFLSVVGGDHWSPASLESALNVSFSVTLDRALSQRALALSVGSGQVMAEFLRSLRARGYQQITMPPGVPVRPPE